MYNVEKVSVDKDGFINLQVTGCLHDNPKPRLNTKKPEIRYHSLIDGFGSVDVSDIITGIDLNKLTPEGKMLTVKAKVSLFIEEKPLPKPAGDSLNLLK